MKVSGLNSLIAKLKKLKADARKVSDASVTVGYSQSYAIYVHEILDNYHPVGQAKYLEDPARNLSDIIAGNIKRVFEQTGDMNQALLVGGLYLQRESQLLVPVDTSALKASAFTCLTKDEDEVAKAAFQKSEGIRVAELDRRKKARAQAKKSKGKKK